MKNTFGYKSESLACTYLRLNGYSVIERNYHSRFGEIDIIAQKNNTLVFVEVKARSGNMLSTPASAVDIYKQQKLIKTANLYIASHIESDCDCRFDVIEIVKQGIKLKIKHIKNAFDC